MYKDNGILYKLCNIYIIEATWVHYGCILYMCEYTILLYINPFINNNLYKILYISLQNRKCERNL